MLLLYVTDKLQNFSPICHFEQTFKFDSVNKGIILF